MATQKPYYIDIEAPIRVVDCEKAFNCLDTREKNYSYYFTRASWEGQKICYFSKSYESPALFYLLMKVFSLQTVEQVKEACLKNGFTEDEWARLAIYLAAFLQNCGNYLSFGDNKFIPEVSREKFWTFLSKSEAFNLEPTKVTKTWEAIVNEIYAYSDPFGHIGLVDLNGLSGYYSANITEADAKLTQEFLDSVKISPLNTRVIKHNDDFFEIQVCSLKSGGKVHEYKNKKFSIVYGEFNVFMTKVIENLKRALPYAQNDTQKEMIQHYINHFITGDMELHKDSQRAWIKDKGPIIETNIGFIEHYLDPMKYRGEWDGLVAIVNKEQSKLLAKLVDNASDLLKNMTWPPEFERETFSKPDFTSLDVLTMATFDVPVGINLPNYDDIRTTEGFKNVNLGNCYPTPSKKTATFVKEEILDTLMKHTQDGLFLQVSLHELLGHGSGKVMQKDKDGKFNWDKDKLLNPLTGKLIDTWYDDMQTFNTKFGAISSGYEECRADSIALYLSTFDESLEILLGDKKENWDDIVFCTWFNILINGVRGLVFYNEAAKLWGQAHITGRYAILQVCLEAGNNFVTIEETEKDGKPYLYLNVDRKQIKTTGRKAIGEYIKHLQIYKAVADVEGGTKFFGKYTAVDEKFLKYRGIVANYKTPRPINIQHDVERIGENEFKYIRFDPTAEGIIKSHVFHHKDSFEDLYPLWLEKRDYFKLQKPSLQLECSK